MKRTSQLARKRLDERLSKVSSIDLSRPPKGWIRALRDALGMSGSQLGKRMGITAQTVDALERSEAAGTIQLQTLSKAAEAMSSRVVYAIVPETSLEEIVRRRAREVARRALERVSHTMRLEDQATSKADHEAWLDEFIDEELRDRDLWSDT